MRNFETTSKIKLLSLRFADGAGGTESETTKSTAETAVQPAAPASASQAETPKAYSDADLEVARAQAVADYKQHMEEAKDYEKMTAEEKVSYLEAQRESDKLTQMTTSKLSAQELPIELLSFIKGKNEAEIDADIKAIKVIIDKAAQLGVEKRFKSNGYLPKGPSAANFADSTQKRERGVKVQ